MPVGLLIVFYFIVVTFISGQPMRTGNPLLSFYDLQFRFILDHLFVFVLLAFLLTVFLTRFNKRKKHKPERYLRFVQRFLVISFAASLVSFFLLFLVAVIQTNALSMLSYVNLRTIGVETDTERILDELKKAERAPDVVAYDGNGKKMVKTASVYQSGKYNFYGSRVIPNLPSTLILTSKIIDSDVLLVGDTLMVKNINSNDFQEISPVVAFLMINDYFPGKAVKPYSQLFLVEKEDYLSFREGNFMDKMEAIDGLIVRITQNVDELSVSIEDQEDEIAQYEVNLRQEKLQREREYTKCVNEGYYDSGVFIRVNTREYCQEQFALQDEAIKQIAKDIEDINFSVSEKRQTIDNSREYLNFYNNQKLLAQSEADYVIDEYAVFYPPDMIKITQTSENDQRALVDYFTVLIHEYLHYETYDESGGGLNSLFFTEGLTEYFAREIVKSRMGVAANFAYPVNVRIITQMMKRISESDMAEIYFSKDNESLEKLIDLVYEKGFLRSNLIALETLHYSSDEEQILSLANEMMAKLGGGLLAKDDIRSENNTFKN